MEAIRSSDEQATTERPLSTGEIAAFHRDGYAIVRGLFSAAEIEPLRQACLADPTIGGRIRAVADSDGNAQEVIGWTEYSSVSWRSSPA
jgi:hypothetical protein